jgi:hypothetical protein
MLVVIGQQHYLENQLILVLKVMIKVHPDQMVATNHSGVNYTYILKDVDFSGKETKSGEVNITTAENNLTVTDKYTLGRTYPNPFNPTFTIPLKLNENAFVNIQLVNILGQKVLQIENSQMAVGNNDLQVNCENLNSGVYFVKVTVDNVNNIQKVVLLK